MTGISSSRSGLTGAERKELMSAHLGGAYIGPAHVTTGEDDDTYWWAEVLLENVQTDEWGIF